MGSELVTPLSFTEVFYEYLPFFLSIGMTPEQYWDGDCTLVVHYRKALEIKQKRRNAEMWLQGMYIYEALCDVAPILHAFARKGTTPVPYSKEPYPITKEEMEERKEREAKAHAEKMKAKMMAYAISNNARMAKKAQKEVKQDGRPGN